jgi:hypothetical protein
MIVTVICFSLVAAIFVSVMVEMYVGLLAGMIMLGLGGSSYTKDFAIRYLVYAFSVGMKLMALVMISRIGSEVLIGLASEPEMGIKFRPRLRLPVLPSWSLSSQSTCPTSCRVSSKGPPSLAEWRRSAMVVKLHRLPPA